MVLRALTAALAAVALTAVVPGPALARPTADSISDTRTGAPGERLPQGWRIEGGALVWRSPEPVGMGGALVEFRSGKRPLGVPEASPDQRTFRLRLDGARIGPPGDLQVVAGSRRLDAPGTDEATGRAPGQQRSLTADGPPDPLPANPVDPGVPGTYRTSSGEYLLEPVRLPGYPEPVEMRATVVGPTDAPGKRPLALFLHGRNATCYEPGRNSAGMQWPCKPGSKELPSYRGHLHDQTLLASQGYVTVSISANGVSAQDGRTADSGAQARSSLIRQHLARWAQWSTNPGQAPEAVRAMRSADLTRVLLVGHSRGGEGVNRAALDSMSPPPPAEDGYRGPVGWQIRGTVMIGPTLFGQNPVPDVPSMTILPGCDGDVNNLQGQLYLDGTRGIGQGAALHSAVYMVGANHNFFNTQWTPGQSEGPAADDFRDGATPDPVCSTRSATRLTAAQQQKAGSTYIAAAARLFLAGDDRVRPLLDGSGRRAPSADPARVLTHALGGNRTPAILPDAPLAVTNGRVCRQVTTDSAQACMTDADTGQSPHFAPWAVTDGEPDRNAVTARWSAPGTPVRLTPERAFSLAGSDALALRVIVPPNTRGTLLDVALTDTSGKRVTLGQVTVDGLPGSASTASHWAREVRVPLTAALPAGVDLKRTRSLELTPRSGSGALWLMDAWGWRPGTPAVHPVALPRVDIGRLTVQEGDSGTRTYRVPVQVTGQGTGVIKLAVRDPQTHRSTVRTVTVGAGGSEEVSITVQGNSRYDLDRNHEVAAKAVRGAVVGSASGGVLVKNDDPMPTVSVRAVADTVTEGQKLVWKVELSQPADTDIDTPFVIVPVGAGPELSTKDVDKDWLSGLGEAADPERPLSENGSYLWIQIRKGQTSTEVSVPTITDTVTEPEETLRMQVKIYQEEGEWPNGPLLTGRVTDGPVSGGTAG